MCFTKRLCHDVDRHIQEYPHKATAWVLQVQMSRVNERVTLFRSKKKNLYPKIREPTLQHVIHGVVDGSNQPQRFPSTNFLSVYKRFWRSRISLCCGSMGKMSRKLPSRHRPCFTWLPHLALKSVWFHKSSYPPTESTGVLIRETTCYIVKKRENKSYEYVVFVLE